MTGLKRNASSSRDQNPLPAWRRLKGSRFCISASFIVAVRSVPVGKRPLRPSSRRVLPGKGNSHPRNRPAMGFLASALSANFPRVANRRRCQAGLGLARKAFDRAWRCRQGSEVARRHAWEFHSCTCQAQAISPRAPRCGKRLVRVRQETSNSRERERVAGYCHWPSADAVARPSGRPLCD